jgi:tetratricopeptide (TPR) repeat protein
MKKIIFLLIIIITITGCSFLATTFTAKKNYEISKSEISENANKYFWDNFHQANYDSIPNIIAKLELALRANPNDLITTTHLGFVHIWASSERQRLNIPNTNALAHISLSRRYFEESNLMNPHDRRVAGFLADLALTEGSILKNKKEQTKGFFIGKNAIKKWPQFNKFTVGYVFSNLDTTDKNFKQGLKWQYETIDDCACEKNTRYTGYTSAVQKVRSSTDPKIYRACWNTWIAPHNWEGFCLNWGDMLVKNGEVDEAERIYNLAKESDTYNEWPFKALLEKRLEERAQNVAPFNKPVDEINLKDQKVIMFNSSIACAGCHQTGKSEFKDLEHSGIDMEKYYFLNSKFK